jgi:hypothetical protein
MKPDGSATLIGRRNVYTGEITWGANREELMAIAAQGSPSAKQADGSGAMQ